MSRHLRTLIALSLTLSLGLGLGACSGSGASSSAADGGSVALAPAQVPAQVPAQAGAAPGVVAGTGGKAAPAAGLPVVGQKLVGTATLRMRVDQVGAAAADVRAIAVGLGGVVSSENISSGDPIGGTPDPVAPGANGATGSPEAGASTATTVVGSASGTMAVQVPAAKLDTALDQLGKLGTVLQRTTSSDDVTSTYVDTSSRVATMTASIDRIRALMVKTAAIDQIVALESELAKREADLESLQATLATLDAQTTMSTVSISLATRLAPAASEPGGPGFLSGLRGGWSAFTTLLGGLVTGLGAVLPFLAALVLVGIPTRVWWRRRSAPAAAALAAGPGATTVAPPVTSAENGPEPAPGAEADGDEAGADAGARTELGR